MGFKIDKVEYSIVKEEYAGTFKQSETILPITEDDLNVICQALFDSRHLIDKRDLRWAIGKLLHPNEQKRIKKLIESYKNENKRQSKKLQ